MDAGVEVCTGPDINMHLAQGLLCEVNRNARVFQME